MPALIVGIFRSQEPRPISAPKNVQNTGEYQVLQYLVLKSLLVLFIGFYAAMSPVPG